MLKGILKVVHCWLLIDKFCQLEVVEHRAERVVSLATERARDAKLEILADYRQYLKQLFLVCR